MNIHSSNHREPGSIGIGNRYVTEAPDQVFVGDAATSASSFPDSLPGALTRRLLPWLVAVAMFMELLDTSILNTAVPTIAKALGVAPLNMKSALTSYMLSLAVFIPISGWIADRFGTRRVFFSAIGLFTFGSLLCGLAINMPMLVISRVIQGCGGALMVPVGRIALVRTFPKPELLRAWSLRHPTPTAMLQGIHHTFLAMGLFTMATALVFHELRPDDGTSLSRLR